MKVSELFGSSHKKGHQRKFFNKKQFEFFDGEKSKGFVTFDFKMTEEELENELKEFMEMTGANKVILVWTANEGHMNVEIEL